MYIRFVFLTIFICVQSRQNENIKCEDQSVYKPPELVGEQGRPISITLTSNLNIKNLNNMRTIEYYNNDHLCLKCNYRGQVKKGIMPKPKLELIGSNERYNNGILSITLGKPYENKIIKCQIMDDGVPLTLAAIITLIYKSSSLSTVRGPNVITNKTTSAVKSSQIKSVLKPALTTIKDVPGQEVEDLWKIIVGGVVAFSIVVGTLYLVVVHICTRCKSRFRSSAHENGDASTTYPTTNDLSNLYENSENILPTPCVISGYPTYNNDGQGIKDLYAKPIPKKLRKKAENAQYATAGYSTPDNSEAYVKKQDMYTKPIPKKFRKEITNVTYTDINDVSYASTRTHPTAIGTTYATIQHSGPVAISSQDYNNDFGDKRYQNFKRTEDYAEAYYVKKAR